MTMQKTANMIFAREMKSATIEPLNLNMYHNDDLLLLISLFEDDLFVTNQIAKGNMTLANGAKMLKLKNHGREYLTVSLDKLHSIRRERGLSQYRTK